MPAGRASPVPTRRKASSTAAMQSSSVRSDATSARVSTSAISGPEDVVAGALLHRRTALAKHARSGRPADDRRRTFHPHPRAFPQPDDGCVVLLVELEDPLLLGLAHVLRRRIGIEEVRADLEVDEPQRIERPGLHDRHVLGRLQRRASDDRSRARADVGHSRKDAAADRFDEIAILQRLQEAEGVPAADEDRVEVVEAVCDGAQVEAHWLEAGPYLGRVRVRIEQSEGNEGDPGGRAEEGADLRLDMVEVPTPPLGRVADEEEPLHGAHSALIVIQLQVNVVLDASTVLLTTGPPRN